MDSVPVYIFIRTNVFLIIKNLEKFDDKLLKSNARKKDRGIFTLIINAKY